MYIFSIMSRCILLYLQYAHSEDTLFFCCQHELNPNGQLSVLFSSVEAFTEAVSSIPTTAWHMQEIHDNSILHIFAKIQYIIMHGQQQGFRHICSLFNPRLWFYIHTKKCVFTRKICSHVTPTSLIKHNLGSRLSVFLNFI